jgi:hypothetical protein
MKTRPGICQRKRRYVTREEADAAALRADVPLRAYKCGLCHQFHLTSRTKGLRVPRAAEDGAGVCKD